MAEEKFVIDCDGKPFAFSILIKSPNNQQVFFDFYDKDYSNTYYLRRQPELVLNTPTRFDFYFPQSPDKMIFTMKSNSRIEILNSSLREIPMLLPEGVDRRTLNFIAFNQNFSQNCGHYAANRRYMYNNDGFSFEIIYLPVIIDTERVLRIKDDRGRVIKEVNNPNYGKELKTSARIHRGKGFIEVSEKYFKYKYTVPMRFLTLMHEYAHFNLNTNPSSETEADLRGLDIYLRMLYPKIEAYYTFTTIFDNTDTPQNRQRHDTIKHFIKNFDQSPYLSKAGLNFVRL